MQHLININWNFIHFNYRMDYDYRIVAFIDILGFTNSIQKSENDREEFQRILTCLNGLKDFFISEKDSYEIDAEREYCADTQIVQVSDCIIFSRLYQEQGGIYQMLSDCAFATHLLISNGFLRRGAIKYGKMYHKGTTLFGKAYIDAYLAEQNEKLPIIKFSNDIFEIVRQFPFPVNKPIAEWEVDFVKKNCKMLDTGEYYIDYFTDYDDLVGEVGLASIHYNKLREIIVKGLNLPNTCSAYEKYLWAAKQFNSSTAEIFQLRKVNI